MAAPTSLRHTPLTALHEAAGARLVDFSGYLMPVQYGGILEEAMRVRNQAGLFDLCHMGRCRIVGERRVEAAQFLVHVNVGLMKQGAIRYSFFARDDGTTMDDVLIYKDEDEIFFCINAGNRERDLAWMEEVAGRYDCTLEDQSDELAMVAIQGPRSVDTVAPLCDQDVGGMKYYSFVRGTIAGVPAMLSRTGYTGEDGFEFYFPEAEATRVWNALLESGAPHGVTPIGLAARDTLRLEAGMALYGHELDDTTNPVEAGIVTKLIKHKHDFSGRAAIEAMVEKGPPRILVGFTTESPRVPRQGYEIVTLDHTTVGSVVSGTKSPTLGTNIGTAYVANGHHLPGTRLAMDVRGKRLEITLHALPFYKRPR
jgi:aminomethyltransferase